MKYFLRVMLFSLFATSCFFIGYDESWAADKDIPKKEIKEKNKLNLWGSIRFRYEKFDNFNAKYYGPSPVSGKDSDGFTLGKFRLGFGYNPNEFIHLSAGIQHSRSWDLAMDESEFYKPIFDRPHNPFDDYWEPFNTYIEIKNFLPFSIKAGRQCLGYGDRMIYGPGEWETQVGGYGML